ncbi:MAG: RpiB/LacA/LacB family sugar-phosphate isomerase [Acidimicrobiia bacterium]
MVARSEVDTAVLCCWTGTGVSIAANKVRGARAALCTDAPSAAGARRRNDVNILVPSLRLASPSVASEMLEAWFATEADPTEATNISSLEPPLLLLTQRGAVGVRPAGRRPRPSAGPGGSIRASRRRGDRRRRRPRRPGRP